MNVAGIDVGGEGKGFHVVALHGKRFSDALVFKKPSQVVAWCIDHKIAVVAVDAPCAWSDGGSSRLAERALSVAGQTIQCFKTPTRAKALENRRRSPDGHGFYGWVFNGMRLYAALANHFQLFDGKRGRSPTVFETFPHAVVCALSGKVVPAKPKAESRRAALRDRHYNEGVLQNIDSVDAGLCAVTAAYFSRDRSHAFGNQAEGFIVVPRV